MENPLKARKSRKSTDALICAVIVALEAGFISYFEGSETMIQTICGLTAGIFGVTIMSQGHADANDDSYGLK